MRAGNARNDGAPGMKALATSSLNAGADPGFFLGGGAPLRNDVTDGEVTKF